MQETGPLTRCAVAALLAASLLPSALGAQQLRLTGRVLADSADMPVSGVRVSLAPGGRATTTDQAGRFALDQLAAGGYRLRVEAPGFRAIERVVRLDQADVALDLRLARPVQLLPELARVGARPRAVGPLRRDGDQLTLATKRAEAIAPRETDAALAINNTRQAFARTPGVMLWEQDGAGIQAGVAIRGLNPNRSWELNTRQNGYDISSDIFGYPEAYFTPPFESLERIEMVRGSAALQYGTQFGGLLNYVVKRGAADRAFHLESSQLTGSNGLYSTYTAVGGTVGRVNYYSFLNYRTGDGWRAGNAFTQYTGYASAEVALSSRTTVGVGVTRMDYDLRQPGGLTEVQFAADPRQALRARDWFGTPWTIPSLQLRHRFSDRVQLQWSTFGLAGERNSVGLTTVPTVADTGRNPRRVDADEYRNIGSEARLTWQASAFGRPSALATGLRWSRGATNRVRGRGTDGDGFDLALTGPRVLDLRFRNENVAAFAEWAVQPLPGLVVTPGLRVEHLVARGEGTFTRAGGTFLPAAGAAPTAFGDRRSETLPLAGLGARLDLGRGIELYGNWNQAWRAALFSDQFPHDVVAVDSALRSARGWTGDAGVRGTIGSALAFDVSGFWLLYDDRVGTLGRAQLGADSLRFPSGVRRNVGTSRHRGVEAFAELDLVTAILGRDAAARHGALLLFTSAAYTDAAYTAGPVAGRRVEHAPEWIARGGLTWRRPGQWSVTVQLSHVSSAFSDASNTPSQANGVQGLIPAYTVADIGARAQLTRWIAAEVNVNNLFDRRYFTRRATGYPGPGIIPADGRTLIAGVRLTS
ncbi:MAG: TonB-dependent receptor [Gemmatimonadales bacterium]|nr:TonB-dependent receptor [Gemmatimonadales bacterium]